MNRHEQMNFGGSAERASGEELNGGTSWDTLSDVRNDETWEQHCANANALKDKRIGKYNLEMSRAIEETPDGVLRVNDAEVLVTKIERKPSPEQTFLVHSTDFFPEDKRVLSNADGNKRVRTVEPLERDLWAVSDIVSPRETVHFTINGRVQDTGDGGGSWSDQKYMIVEPYAGHEAEFATDIHGGDNYTNESVKLSDDAILMVREDAYADLNDEQRREYNIVKYAGDPTKCVDNLLTAMGMPVVKNEANDATHAHSEQYREEFALEQRAEWAKKFMGIELTKQKGGAFLREEDVAMLCKYNRYDRDHDSMVDTKAVAELADALGVREDTAGTLLKEGVYRNAGGYAMLSNQETKEHWNDAQWYAERFQKSGLGASELEHYMDTHDTEAYQRESTAEKNHYGDLSVGLLQRAQNFGVLKQWKDGLGLKEGESIVLRDDGIYLNRSNQGSDSWWNELKSGEKDVKLGGNASTMREAAERYARLEAEG